MLHTAISTHYHTSIILRGTSNTGIRNLEFEVIPGVNSESVIGSLAHVHS